MRQGAHQSSKSVRSVVAVVTRHSNVRLHPRKKQVKKVPNSYHVAMTEEKKNN